MTIDHIQEDKRDALNAKRTVVKGIHLVRIMMQTQMKMTLQMMKADFCNHYTCTNTVLLCNTV